MHGSLITCVGKFEKKFYDKVTREVQNTIVNQKEIVGPSAADPKISTSVLHP